MFRRLMQFASVAVLGLFAGTAVAEEGNAAVSYIQGAVTTDIQAVGAALIILAAIVMGIRWVKAMFF